MATILDGKKLSIKILDELVAKIEKLDKKPSLAVILVGENIGSELYVSLKTKAAEKVGIVTTTIKYPEMVEEATLLNKIKELNNDPNVDAILVQLPLSNHINTKTVIRAISPKKDADGITPENIGRISVGLEPYAYPCTPKGVLRLLEEYNINLKGKHVVIIGRSNIVGKPLAQMALNKDATVTICHSLTEGLKDITTKADILISAIGVSKHITKDMIKANSIIVDVGISKVLGKVLGDVDFEGVFGLVSYITPVPGGIGPMTIASLMENAYELSKLNRNT